MEKNISEVELWLGEAREKGLLSQLANLAGPAITDEDLAKQSFEGKQDLLFPSSVQKAGNDLLALAKLKSGAALILLGKNRGGFKGTKRTEAGIEVFFCPLDHRNADCLRRVLPYTAPSPLADIDVTFGVGDRLGIATAGHIRLFKTLDEEAVKLGSFTFAPVFAQQSVREITLCGRTYEDVLDSATWAVFQENYRKPWGADGDHLKTAGWVRKSLRIGFTMITADVSDYIRGKFASLEEREILSLYEKRLDEKYRDRLEGKYLALRLKLDTGEEIRIGRPELARIALIYSDALDYANKLYRAGLRTGRPFDFELSIDETETPTLPQAHVFIAMEMEARGVKIASLAPRFVGEFQKGIDYIGERREFEATFRTHASIARHFGYRISIHSGSDKFMVFPTVGKETNHRFHLKTAGTNWLQALLVIAQTEPAFFRKLYETAIKVFPEARKYYHITPNLNNLPALAALMDKQLPVVFENTDARQVLHVTYGEMLRDRDLKSQIYKVLEQHIEEYWDSLVNHIGKHLRYLGVMK
jgi:hypothetical protein